MQTIDCIRDRRSVREYRQDPIPEKVLEEILESAVQAPSAGNVQDWEFVVVKNPDIKKRIVEAALGQDFIYNASVVLVVCSDVDRISNAYGTRGANLYSVQDTSAAIQNILLAAWDKEIGSCWIGAFNEKMIKDILVLPSNVRPMAIITLGYPVKVTEKSERRDLKDVLHMEYWGKR